MRDEAQKYFDDKKSRMKDADKRFFERPPVDPANVHEVYFTGICGKGTGSLAGLFVESGYSVSGSDTGCYPPMSDMIKQLGIKFYEGYSAEHVANRDVTIVANMFGPDNVEIAYLRENHRPQLSFPEAVQKFFIRDLHSIVIAGTHGKTTTTGMMAHVLHSAGRNPGFLVGGVMVKTARTDTADSLGEVSYLAPTPETKHFIIEGDEYDTAYFDKSPKFLHYTPQTAVITSLEFDHADIYSSLDEYRQAFIFLVQEVPKNGHLILNSDWPEVLALKQFSEAPVTTYGLGEENNITAQNIVTDEHGQHFDLIVKGYSGEKNSEGSSKNLGRLTINLFGRYNLANALSVAAVALQQGLSFDEIREGLASFLGMKRRQEIIFPDRNISKNNSEKNITVIDDFAHHPTAVRETLAGIRERYKNNRIIAVFEPRSNTSRKKMFENDYGNSFGSVNQIYLSMPELREMDNPADFIDGNAVIKIAGEHGVTGFCFKHADEILPVLVPDLKTGDVVVIMSNGNFDGIQEKLIAALERF